MSVYRSGKLQQQLVKLKVHKVGPTLLVSGWIWNGFSKL